MFAPNSLGRLEPGFHMKKELYVILKGVIGMI